MLILWVSLGIFLLLSNYKSTSTSFIWKVKTENQIYIEHQQNGFGLYNSAYPLTPWVRGSTGILKYPIAVIADMDMYSKHPTEENTWISYVKKGHLSVCMAKQTVTVEWEEELQILESRMSYGGRGMELSELIVFNGKLYSFDDRTGIVYEINLSSNKATPWVILADGNGRERSGFKSEWATVKDNSLIVGGIGKDWTSPNGDIINGNQQWIKVITPSGLITHHNWTQYYEKLRQSVGIYFPGYMIHESCIWSEVWQRWMFLPRKMSTIPYDYTFDQQHAGTNLMLQATENFENIEVTYVGDKVEMHGFSTFKFVPGLNDEVIVAIKTIEKDRHTASYIMAFDINSNILMPETKIFDCKFEGIEFV